MVKKDFLNLTVLIVWVNICDHFCYWLTQVVFEKDQNMVVGIIYDTDLSIKVYSSPLCFCGM